MATERRAMLLVGIIIEAYLIADGGEDWRFYLAASQLLAEIVKNNVMKGSTAEMQSWGAYLFVRTGRPDQPVCKCNVSVLSI